METYPVLIRGTGFSAWFCFVGLPLSGLTGHFSGQDAMELHKLAFPDRPQPMLVDEEVGTTSKN